MGVGLSIGVSVAVGVSAGTGVSVAVAVAVAVGVVVAVEVGVAVAVGVAVGGGTYRTMSLGRCSMLPFAATSSEAVKCMSSVSNGSSGCNERP